MPRITAWRCLTRIIQQRRGSPALRASTSAKSALALCCILPAVSRRASRSSTWARPSTRKPRRSRRSLATPWPKG
ncbi:unnamed protein product [Effrenium voratum]|uniref:Uncharacterized protein n=1 Tax=Effrenium voratum TaxID=2562239 RepID=A0AA36HWL4_9DINO|nr:unnamed protein product [Effrenium voratum]